MLVAIGLALAILATVGTGLYLAEYRGGAPNGGHVQDVLIIASDTGYNDSADHGVPQNPWPVVHVTKGTVVNFTVTNVDKQAHGFQVQHYLDSDIETVAPGQSLKVSFVATESGTFRIYCDIPCTVHWAMQSGELIVS
jgi:FtsP/CotA-like multicopper oxidase with cupredoxin domain